jgi:hypothetical protein
VGKWVIEIPLSQERYGIFGHGCLLDIVAGALESTREFFFPTQIECPGNNSLFDRPVPLPHDVVREALDTLANDPSRHLEDPVATDPERAIRAVVSR